MIGFDAFLEEVRAFVAGVWTDVSEVIQAEYAEQLAFADKELPYAVYALAETNRAEWAGDLQSFEPVLDIYYVTALEGESGPIRLTLEALAAAFIPDAAAAPEPLLTAQVLDVEGLETSLDHPANQVLNASGLPARAGVLSVRFLLTS